MGRRRRVEGRQGDGVGGGVRSVAAAHQQRLAGAQHLGHELGRHRIQAVELLHFQGVQVGAQLHPRDAAQRARVAAQLQIALPQLPAQSKKQDIIKTNCIPITLPRRIGHDL